MIKIFNSLIFLLVISYLFSIYKYYSSSKNIDNKNYNRLNIEKILSKQISNLPILKDDTNNIIEFNDSPKSDIESDKRRSFWELIK